MPNNRVGASAQGSAPAGDRCPTGHFEITEITEGEKARGMQLLRAQQSQEKTMFNAQQIKPEMPVVCSEDGQFAVVDKVVGPTTIKLKKDDSGKHHFIPL